MRDTLYKVRYRTDLYEWDKGWLDHTCCVRWHKFFETFENRYWHLIKPQGYGDCERLASVYSCVYLHPMSGLLTLHDDKEVDQIKKILTELCEASGGKLAHFMVQEVEYELKV